MRTILIAVLFVSLCLCVVDAKPKNLGKPQGPVPSHYRPPLIDTSATSSTEKRSQLTTLAKIVSREPAAAKLPPVRASFTDSDLWNGEDVTAEDRADKAAKIIRKEIKSLKALIGQGEAIVKVLPAKKLRLKALNKRLKKLTAHRAKAEAAEKLEQQQALLKAIAKQEKAMAKRLAALKKPKLN